ncbi:hypothetical protein Tco_0223089 [Tanacetum coccineum]
MQDKNIAISELKKLIEKCKGKSVETQFDKPSVVRQPNAQRIPKPSVLGKPTPFSNSPEMRSFQTKQSVNKTNVSEGKSTCLEERSSGNDLLTGNRGSYSTQYLFRNNFLNSKSSFKSKSSQHKAWFLLAYEDFLHLTSNNITLLSKKEVCTVLT